MTTSTIPSPTIDPAFQQLAISPRLPFYVLQFQEMLESEQAKRERFYVEMGEGKKTEFINGEVIIHSPVKLRHLVASQHLNILLNTYVHKHQLGFVGVAKLLICLTRNDYEPDICFFRQERAQQFAPDQMKFPAPDFIVEILSESTAQYDRGIKFEDYAAHGVTEYWIIDPQQESVEQYLLDEQAQVYRLNVKVKIGTLQSAAVQGFDIPVRAIFDEKEHWQALQDIVNTV